MAREVDHWVRRACGWVAIEVATSEVAVSRRRMCVCLGRVLGVEVEGGRKEGKRYRCAVQECMV